MALVQVHMVSGFEPDTTELDILSQSPIVSFTQYEFEDGVLTFYFDDVSISFVY